MTLNYLTKINVKLLNEAFFKEFPLPFYATPESAGVDLRACVDSDVDVCPGDRFLCPTGLAFDLNNANLAMFLIPKSGLGHKKGIILGNSVGLLDSTDNQEVFVSVWNTSNAMFTIQRGMYVAQAYFAPIVRVEWKIVTNFN